MTSDFRQLLTHLESALKAPLPGPAAQALMAPRPPRLWPANHDRASIRDAAGLLLLFPAGHRPHLVLTLRAGTLERHGGQVSLPGGAVDADETLEDAARREAREEIGLDASGIRTLGRLTPVDIQTSGFRLHPIVAATPTRPSLTPADGEVARILEIPLERLMDPQTVVWRTLVRDRRRARVPAFLVEDTEIWGATAMVLAEFLAMVGGWKGPAAE